MYRAVRQQQQYQLHVLHQQPTVPSPQLFPLPPIRRMPQHQPQTSSTARQQRVPSSGGATDAGGRGQAAQIHQTQQPTTTVQQQQQQQRVQLCQQWDVPGNGMREVNVVVEGEQSPLQLLVVRRGDDFFALQANCSNCGERLVGGVLCKSHIRCATHGSAYNLRTGLLEFGVGLNSIWTFKVHAVESVLFADVSAQKLKAVRLGPEPPPLLRSPASVHKSPIVVVGAGIAGLTCVEALRQLGYTGPILMISRERELPYDRKSLSKRLLSPDDATPTLRSRHFFDRLAISLCLGHAVKAIRPDERRVMVESSSRGGDAQRAVEYSELVLALGATNRRLQAVKEADELEGVLQLRTVEDAHRLAEEVRGRNVAVIGSGFLGFEIASVVASAAQNVSIYGKAATPLKVLGSEVGNAIRKYMQSQGVCVRQESILRSMAGYDRVQQLTFRDGLTTNCDAVIVAIGVMPSTSVLLGSGIRTNAEGYVLVDERMATNVPQVYACGDCVNFPLCSGIGSPGRQERRVNLPHWQIAQHQGRVAAYTILGVDFVPRLVPFIWVRLFDRHIAFSGDPTVESDERICRGSIAGNDFVAYFLRADRVCAVAGCGPANVAVQFTELFRRGMAITKAEVQKNTGDNWQHLIDQ